MARSLDSMYRQCISCPHIRDSIVQNMHQRIYVSEYLVTCGTPITNCTVSLKMLYLINIYVVESMITATLVERVLLLDCSCNTCAQLHVLGPVPIHRPITSSDPSA